MNDAQRLRTVLQRVAAGELSVEEGVRTLAKPPAMSYITTKTARLDIDRSRRRGLPEVVYCESKTPAQVREIFTALAERGELALGTRASQAHYRAVRKALSAAVYDPIGRLLVWRPDPPAAALQPPGAEEGPPLWELLQAGETPGDPDAPYVALVSAGSGDDPVLHEAAGTLAVFGHPVRVIKDCGVAGLQRILDHVDVLRKAHVVIVIAGMDGALPSVVAGLIPTPVIAVPTSVGYGANFGGLAALLTMLNSCAEGVCVVNIDNGFGAAYAASLILRKVMNRAGA